MVALHHLALLADEDQVRNANMRKMHAERIDPEVVEQLRIARRDVPGNPFAEGKLREKAEGRCQALLAVQAFLCDGCECRRIRRLGDPYLGWKRRCCHRNLAVSSDDAAPLILRLHVKQSNRVSNPPSGRFQAAKPK